MNMMSLSVSASLLDGRMLRGRRYREVKDALRTFRETAERYNTRVAQENARLNSMPQKQMELLIAEVDDLIRKIWKARNTILSIIGPLLIRKAWYLRFWDWENDNEPPRYHFDDYVPTIQGAHDGAQLLTGTRTFDGTDPPMTT